MILGMNLSPPAYWIEQPFRDRMKASGDWAVQGAGWYCMVPMDSPGAVFEALWDGPAKIRIPNTITTEPGRIVFKAAADLTKAQMQVKASGEIPTTLRIVRQDRLAVAGLFRPDYLDSLRGYGQIRFMDWMRTNEQMPRPTIGQQSWFWGVPLSVCLDLAKAIGARPWVNLPAQATDEDIRAFGQACPPDADIEDTNELWNTGFKIGRQTAAEAKAAGIDKGVWIARRQMVRAKLLEGVGRKLVVGFQPTTNAKGWDKYNAALLEAGATSRNVSRVMTTCYPTGGINSLAKITPFMAAGDVAGAVALIRQDAIDNAGARFAVAKALADKLGVPWSVYEGNVAHLNTSAGSDTAVPFVAKVQMHPDMREIGEILLAEAEKHGCDVFNVFNHSSPATRYGFFGVKGTPFGALLDGRRTIKPEPAPRTIEERVADLEAWRAGIEARW